MEGRRFEVTILTRPAPIEINRPHTWPEALRSVIRELDRRTAATHYIGDLRISEEASARVAETLTGHAVVARHCTRLLPHEADWIRSIGLLMHSKELFDQRIDGARQFGYLGADIVPRLKAGTIPAAEVGERGDRGFVCMTIGPVMETDFSAVSSLLRNWGGEGIYFAGGTARYKTALRSLNLQSKPAAVLVHLPVTAPVQLRFHPPLEHLLLGRHREMARVHGDVFSRAAIPPDAIAEIDYMEDM